MGDIIKPFSLSTFVFKIQTLVGIAFKSIGKTVLKKKKKERKRSFKIEICH
jgi:hypothetical protein